MLLSKEALASFKKIYFEEFKVVLSDEMADCKGKELLQFISLIYKPIPKEVPSVNTDTSIRKNEVV